jgi:hypothetical protein
LHAVRAYLSTQVLGSPKHFPTHLRRWSALGQISNAPLEKLLMLGDPEAVFAVACSSKLTVELAERAWWSMPEPAIARALLANSDVAGSPIGGTLATWLFDYLPFEESPENLFDAVALLLRPGLLDEAATRKIWEKGRRNKIYRAAYLSVRPDQLPSAVTVRKLSDEQRGALERAASGGDRGATLLLEAFAADTQAFFAACHDVLSHAAYPLEVTATFASIEKRLSHFGDAAPSESLAEWIGEIEALRRIGTIQEAQLTPILARSDAIGSVMRTQLRPLIDPVLKSLRLLGGP